MLSNPTLIDIRNAVLTVFLIIMVVVVNVSALWNAYSLIGAVNAFPQIIGPIEKGAAIEAFIKAFAIIFISAKGTIPLLGLVIDLFTAFRTLNHHFHLNDSVSLMNWDS